MLYANQHHKPTGVNTECLTYSLGIGCDTTESSSWSSDSAIEMIEDESAIIRASTCVQSSIIIFGN